MIEHDEVPQSVVGALLASGFPFQTAVANAVTQLHDWKIVTEEFPWRDDLNGDQFLDVVASSGRFVVAIECKKTQKEILTFLQPGSGSATVTRARILYLEQIQDSTKKDGDLLRGPVPITGFARVGLLRSQYERFRQRPEAS